MKRIHQVAVSGGRGYPVFCGDGLAAGLDGCWNPAWHAAVILGDENTQRLFGSELAAAVGSRVERLLRLDFKAGEEHKTRATKAAIEDAMLAEGFGRDSCVLAVGGGIALDVGGFVAATFMRGIAHIHVATTLLAQVDAAIGGKCAVNTPQGKNLIGSFHQPHGVLLYTPALDQLAACEMRNGLVEAIKHAVLWDARLFEALEATVANKQLRPSDAVVARCVTIKAEIVCQDERDTGIRQILNFGHTVGHALEMASHHRLRHGEAVAIGMLVELALHDELDALRQRLERLLRAAGLATTAPTDFSEMAAHLQSDKKNQRGTIHCALPKALGMVGDGAGPWTEAVEPIALERAWQRCFA